MRYLLLILITSCQLHLPNRDVKNKKSLTNIDKVRSCIEDFMSKHGVKASVAYDVCTKIYRR